ncbi:hypothetical protein Btru_072464 [Bulinus truncatus]|nr:hypothetical protein Btru_072464 [Bulinus truncatus]
MEIHKSGADASANVWHCDGKTPTGLNFVHNLPRFDNKKDLVTCDGPPETVVTCDEPPETLVNCEEPPETLVNCDEPPDTLVTHEVPPEELVTHEEPPKTLVNRYEPPGEQRRKANRYRSCDEGCCVHEYCAFHRICYPKIHCRFGCPDGRCVGQVTSTPSAEIIPPFGEKKTVSDSPAKFSDIIKERFPPSGKGDKHNNQVVRLVNRNRGGREHIDKDENNHGNGVKPEETFSGRVKDTTDGICMPDPPCKPTDHCGMAHSCSMNYNLGYRTCQYNLDIGSTLCFDSKGNLNLKPMT